jgi:hypothetical protein
LLIKLGTKELLHNVVQAMSSHDIELVASAVRCLAAFFQTDERDIFRITREEGYLLKAQILLHMNDIGTNLQKEVLWGLSNFVCDGKESTKAFVEHQDLTRKVIELNSSEIFVFRNESCWVLGNAIDEANVEDLKILWN